jgi:phage gp36-like protein
MSYATQQQLIERYSQRMLIQLTDRAVPPTGTIDATVVTRALADTDAMIDGYLAARYALPLASTPALITDLALQIAIYKLHRKVAEEKIRKDYDDAQKLLRDISTGVVRLSVAGVEPAAGSGASLVVTNEPDRPLSSDGFEGLI